MAGSFKFNFQAEDNVRESSEKRDASLISEPDWCFSVSDVVPTCDESFMKEADKVATTMQIGSYTIKHLTSYSAFNIITGLGRNCKYLTSDTNNSDLIPGAYEGGFKTWECAIDLAKFLEEENCFALKPTVLELGCGSGVPGLLGFVQGCEVTFQDFNKEVLETLTIPNTFLNIPNESRSGSQNCLFLAGHWGGIKAKYYSVNGKSKKYEIILTSETIYDQSSQCHLLELMKSALRPNGKIYLASKTHYFGVGGTLDDFISLVEKDGVFAWRTSYTFPHGVQRKIIMLQFKPGE